MRKMKDNQRRNEQIKGKVKERRAWPGKERKRYREKGVACKRNESERGNGRGLEKIEK